MPTKAPPQELLASGPCPPNKEGQHWRSIIDSKIADGMKPIHPGILLLRVRLDMWLGPKKHTTMMMCDFVQEEFGSPFLLLLVDWWLVIQRERNLSPTFVVCITC
jgi:hypothetical protein